MGLWGWRHGDGWLRVVFAAFIPIAAAVLWGVFNVPGDPSRSGTAPVSVPGVLRLALEAVVFGVGILALADSGFTRSSVAFGMVVTIHYAFSYDRIAWLLNQ